MLTLYDMYFNFRKEMRRGFVFIILMALGLADVFAQAFPQPTEAPQGLKVSAEVYGGAFSGGSAAFWSVHGQGGRRSLRSTSVLLDITASYRHLLGQGHEITGVLEGMIESGLKPIYRVRQFGVAYKNDWAGVKIGAMDYQQPIEYSPQTSGPMVLSNNALPIPMILLHTNNFIEIPRTNGLVSIFADFSVGRFFEKKFNQLTYPDPIKGQYTIGTLWHHKTGYLRIGNKNAAIPLTFTLGGTHAAHWGGRHIGLDKKEPTSFKDFIKVLLGKSGGSDATISDQINVLGNHYGQYLFELAWHAPRSTWQLYHLHIFEDKSGMEFNNGPDGLWGLHLNLKEKSLPISDAVVEYITTLNQSGPFHILDFERPNGEGRGGGNDGYYSNGEYRGGASYVGMNIGNPLLIARGYANYLPEEQKRYRNDRIQALHIGIGGEIESLWNICYEAKLTFVKSMGSFSSRLVKPTRSSYSYLRLQAPIQRVDGLSVGLEMGMDLGNYTPKTFGGGLSVKYEFGREQF